MSTGVIFILGKGVIPILASGVKSTWPQGSSGTTVRDSVLKPACISSNFAVKIELWTKWNYTRRFQYAIADGCTFHRPNSS